MHARLAIFAGQKITFQQLDSRSGRSALDDGFDAAEIARWPNKTDQVAKPTIQQRLYHSRSYETGSPCYQNSIIRAGYETVA